MQKYREWLILQLCQDGLPSFLNVLFLDEQTFANSGITIIIKINKLVQTNPTKHKHVLFLNKTT